MFAIAGGTGNVGSAAATELLTRGEKVRAVVRSATKGQGWEQRGADAAVADLGDRSGLAEALRGCTGFFAMLPSDFTVAAYAYVGAFTWCTVFIGIGYILGAQWENVFRVMHRYGLVVLWILVPVVLLVIARFLYWQHHRYNSLRK